jgi:hypothetical protein
MSAPGNFRHPVRRGLAIPDFASRLGEARAFELRQRVPQPRRSRLPFVIVMTVVVAFILVQVIPVLRPSSDRIAAGAAPQPALIAPAAGVKLAAVDPSGSVSGSVPKPAKIFTTRLLKPILRAADEPARAAAGDAVPLGLSVEGSAEGVVAVVTDLLPGSSLSAGEAVGPRAWQVPAHDLAGVLVRPPSGFSGAMEVVVDLQGAGEQILDRRWRRLEWQVARAAATVPADTGVAAAEETKAAALSAATAAKPSAAIMVTNARSTPETVSSAKDGNYVQVSSQRTELAAQSSFKALQQKFPNIFGNRQPIIRRADLGEKGTYYRVMVGPLGTEQAVALCNSLKASGSPCMVRQN